MKQTDRLIMGRLVFYKRLDFPRHYRLKLISNILSHNLYKYADKIINQNRIFLREYDRLDEEFMCVDKLLRNTAWWQFRKKSKLNKAWCMSLRRLHQKGRQVKQYSSILDDLRKQHELIKYID